ncbi:MAG: site-specific tyrosine recombinase XerD [Phycisphaerae bacterium]
MSNFLENPQNSLRPALAEFLNHLVVERGLSPNTISAYTRDLNRLVDFLSDHKIDRPDLIRGSAVQGFLGYLAQQNLVQSSIARSAAAVRTFLKFLFLNNKIKSDPATMIDTPKPGHKLPKVLARTQIEAILQAIPTDDKLALRDCAILEMFYACGLRVSELCDLRLSDLDFTLGIVKCIGKGRRERIVPIGRPAIEAVEKYIKHLRGQLGAHARSSGLFLTHRGGPLDRINTWRMIKKYALRAQLNPGKVSPHTFRHSFASHLLEGGADLRVVQELLGHANVATTQIYTHIDQRRLKSIHRRFHPRR